MAQSQPRLSPAPVATKLPSRMSAGLGAVWAEVPEALGFGIQGAGAAEGARRGKQKNMAEG